VSVFALVRKLGDLGVAGATDTLARILHGGFTLGVLGLAVLAARVQGSRPRALAWFALLNLAAMTSPAAWGDYVPVGTLWMLTFLMVGSDRIRPAVWAGVGVLSFLLPGVVPIGSFPGPALAMALSVVGTLVWIAVNGWIVAREARPPAPRVPAV